MKRLLILLSFMLLSSPVMAKTIQVQAMSDFSSENPPENYSVKVLEDVYIEDQIVLQNGFILNGKIVDVKDPKRLKRNATFTFVPLEYIDLNSVTHSISGYYPGKYTTKLNKGQLAKSAALTVGSYFVKGLSLGYSAVEGAIKNEEDNRFKSGAKAVYEDSPFSYVEKGHELIIPKDSIFFLKFRAKDEPDEEDESNYEYEMPEDIKPENSVQESEQVHSNLNNTQSDSDEDSLISE